MKLTTGIVALALTAGTAWAQNPNIIQNTKNALQGVQQKQTAASNAALQGTSSAPAKPSPAAPAKPGPAPVAPAKTVAPAQAAVKPATAASAPARKPAPAVKPSSAPAQSAVKVIPMKAIPAPGQAKTKAVAKAAPVAPKPAAAPKATAAVASSTPEAPKEEKQEEKKYSMTGKRDPFVSPVVNRQSGSGCSTGKKCLDIEQIALRGVVKSDNGMIAVVTNGLNKAYFLRENDPVFNGYVIKITVDSIVFKQNFQDRLGKPFTKDVVKRITTPAV
jgi:Tfp pilus assembly protein PilP